MRPTWAIGRPGRAALTSPRLWLTGFTLIELLVVLAILVMIAGILPLALDHALPARRVDGAARRVAATIRDAEGDSIASGRAVTIQVARGGSVLRAGNRATSLQGGIHLTLTGPEGQPLTELVVYPDGSATAALVSVTDGQHRRAVSISGISGHVALERDHPGDR